MVHRELFGLADLDDGQRRLPFGKGGCEDFLEVGDRFWRIVAGKAPRLGFDQGNVPTMLLPHDRAVIDAGQLMRDVERSRDAEGLPERIGERLGTVREHRGSRARISYPIWFN